MVESIGGKMGIEDEDEELKAMLNADVDRYYEEKIRLIASGRELEDLKTAGWVKRDPQLQVFVLGELY
jgi:thermostable 8-oxoguanine DNA glycosylase